MRKPSGGANKWWRIFWEAEEEVRSSMEDVGGTVSYRGVSHFFSRSLCVERPSLPSPDSLPRRRSLFPICLSFVRIELALIVARLILLTFIFGVSAPD